MSQRSLPPLHFLHALEAAARLGSFRAAAAELHLTASAVSQQIRAIESSLDTRLFVRQGRAVILTAEGQLYCQDVRRALDELHEAGRRLAARSNAHVLRLSTVDFLAHEFLIPRLSLFQARFPGVELRIETSMRVVELQTSEVDAALRVRGSVGPGLASVPIGAVSATVVACPERARRLKRTEDLCDETLLEMGGGSDASWPVLMHKHGFGERPLRILGFESYFQALTAAERGLGVAFGLFPMTTEWVQRGRLAVPFKTRTAVEGGVYLAFRAQDRRRALLQEIAAFLAEQYAALPTLPAGRIV
jgi:LysR family transcriptional regulator, glycine cleavage system transcriptional activator